MTQHIAQLTLHATLQLDGLVGEDVEYALDVGHYLTTGQHRAQQKIPIPKPDEKGLSQVQLVYKNLPPLASLDGSENVKVELFSGSHYSLVPEIDAKERDHNEYTVNSGRVSLPLHELLSTITTGQPLERPLVDAMLLDQELVKGQYVWLSNMNPVAMQTASMSDFRNTSLYKDIVIQCRKGTLRIQAQVDNPKALKTYLNHLNQSLAKAEQADGPYNFNTQRFKRELETHNDQFQLQYMKYYLMDVAANKPARFDARASMPEASLLHLTLDRHHDGHRPAVHYFRNRTQTELKEYPFSKGAISYFESMFSSALLTVGMSSDQFIQAVQKQTTSPTTSPETVRAVRGVSYFAAKPAHTIYYSMDVSYKNPKTAAKLDAITGQATTGSLSSLHQQSLKLFGFTYGRSKLFRDNEKGMLMKLASFQEPARVTKYVSLGDRFSKDTMTGVSTSGDCDDMGGGNAMNNYMTPRQIHAQFGSGISPLLDAYVTLTNWYVPFAAGSMVTSAFFDESKNAVMSADDRRSIIDLPLKTSAAYRKAENGGHCHLILSPRPVVAAELQRAGQFSDVLIAKALGVASLDHFAPHEKTLPRGLVEGTGQVDGFSVLAANEVHPSMVGEATALRTARKLIQQSCPILRENLRGLASNFYAERPPNPDRSTNSFFRVFEHLLAPTLYESDPRMGHFVTCDMSDRTRGVDAETYLRMNPNMALVSHMADLPRNVIEKREEIYACIDRQQALNITYRFKEDFAQDQQHLAPPHDMAMSRIGHMLPTFNVLNGMTMTDLRLQLDQHALGAWNMNKRTVIGGNDSNNTSSSSSLTDTSRLCEGTGTLTLFVRPWHLIAMNREGLQTDLQTLRKQGVVQDVDPFIFHERPLTQCDDMITVIMPLPKK
jgi:hypothetical protein